MFGICFDWGISGDFKPIYLLYYVAETKEPIVVFKLYKKGVILVEIRASMHLGKRKARSEENWDFRQKELISV